MWSCKDSKKGFEVAVKVAKRNQSSTEQARDEVELLKCIGEAGNGVGSDSVMKMMGNFELKGHICIVLELLGPHLLRCLPAGGMCLDNVKMIMRQVLEALSFLHQKAQIIHTDVKPENVLIMGSCSEADAFKEPIMGLKVKVADLGSSCWVDKKFSVKIGTQEYRAPEVLLQADYSTPADIWSSACLAFELATSDYLFYPQDASDPAEYFSKDEDHLALITELLGPLPASLLKRGNWERFYKSTKKTGGFKHIPASQLDHKPLSKVLEADCGWTSSNARDFSSWLLPMLALDPEDRITALDSSLHPFIQLQQGGQERRKVVRMKSIAANAEMKNLATKVRVTKLRDREGGSKMVRSATPMSKLRAPLERPKERLRQAVTRHQTAANLPPLDSLIIAGNSVFHLTLPYLFAKTKASQQISSLPQWLKTLGRMECAAAKLLLVTLVGFQLVFFIPIPFELFLLT